jgi:hypothetical protein
MESGSAPFCMPLYSAMTCIEWREIRASKPARELWWLKVIMLCSESIVAVSTVGCQC